MPLNSIMFFTIFFAFLPIYYLFPNRKWLPLILFNYYFYIIAMPEYLPFIFLSSLGAYFIGLLIDNIKNNSFKKITLIFSIVIFLSFLIFFKYFHFLCTTFKFETIENEVLTYFSTTSLIKSNRNSIIAPIGISFFTLQILSYFIDIYRGKLKAEKHLGYMLVYISFFGTILSGPIERAVDFLPQLKKKINFDIDEIFIGFKSIIYGLFLKIVVADRLSVFVNTVYDNANYYKGYQVIFATIFFGFQLYCDFFGYSLMALGFSKALGINIMKNFDTPYLSKSTFEFWRRWHISLSTWFKDYVYIPLGGSRISSIRTNLNRIIVFTLSGIWHGANLTFMFWGFLHGFYQVMGSFKNKLLKDKILIKNKNLSSFISIITTFIFIDFAWLFFRADSFQTAKVLIKGSFKHLNPKNLAALTNIVNTNELILLLLLILIVVIIDIMHYRKVTLNKTFEFAFYTFIIVLTLFFSISSSANFIYFKF